MIKSKQKSKSKQSDDQNLSWQQKLWREVKGYAEAIIIALVITTFLFTTVGVAGSSMAPSLDGGNGSIINSLLTGDRLFVPKYETWLRRARILGHYQRGSVIIFREPADSPYVGSRRDFLVKRLVGLPGDTVRLENGRVFVNGFELDQSFLTDNGGNLGSSNLNEITVPANEYFVLGDNRTNSVDSRVYGTIPFMSVAGRAPSVIWPPRRDGAMNWRVLTPPASFASIPDAAE